MVCLSFAPPETPSQLTIWHKDGSRIVLNLAEQPKISYIGENVLIESTTTVEFPFQAIRKMTYGGEDIPTDMELTTISNGKPFINEGNSITFLPEENDLNVRIVLMNGTVYKDFVVKKGCPLSLSLEPSPAKIFLMNVNGITYKIMVK